MANHLRDLKPDTRNARKHNPRNVGQIERSIQANGFGRSLLLANDGTIIAGNATYDAASSVGLENVLVVETDGTQVIAVKRTDVAPGSKQFHELAIADNRAAELADWDSGVLQLLAEQDQIDLTQFFQDDELNALLADLNKTEGLTDPDDVPAVPDEPVTKPGDLWLLGDHVLLCGDCRDFSDVTKLFAGNQANVVVTSPPYASQRTYDASSGFRPIHQDAYVEWFRDVATNVMAVLADDGSYFLNIKEHCDDGQRHLYVKDLTIAHVREWGWKFIDELCWQRSALPGVFGPRFKNQWEPIFHFARNEPKFRPEHVLINSDLSAYLTYDETDGEFTMGQDFTGRNTAAKGVRSKNHGGARPGNVIESSSREHSGFGATFPRAVPQFCIEAFSDPGDIVFDPFAGSGTTLIAAHQTGRIGYGIEISPAYCDVIVARWERFTGQTATLAQRAEAA